MTLPIIQITKEAMYQNLLRLLGHLFRLPGADKVQIKQYEISSLQDTEQIRQGVEACYHDQFSDIDLCFFTSGRNPLRPEQFGFPKETLLGLSRRTETQEDGTVYTLFRVILKNGMRYDIGIFQPEVLEEELPEAEQAARQWDSFWFIAVQALAKLYRRDYLIADHLANLLINETLVAQMVERDTCYGTTFHRYGYSEELAYRSGTREYASFFSQLLVQDEIFSYIADKLLRAAETYDRLTLAAYPTYEERRFFFSALWRYYHQATEETATKYERFRV